MQKLSNVVLYFALISLAGCAAMGMDDDDRDRSASTYEREEVGTVQQTEQIEEATVVSLEPVDIEEDDSHVGTVIGAVAGGLAGRQLGSGTGRDIMTVIGAAAGGYAGKEAQERMRDGEARAAGVEIGLELDDGRQIAVVQELEENEEFRVGERVEVVFMGDDKAEVRHDDTEPRSYGFRG